MSESTVVRSGTEERERAFAIEELFFSTTDRRGVIRSGNDVFVAVSGFARDELIGRPHNIIRHRGTPKAVFRLLWRHLEAGQPIAAYVKNRAKDGSYYWVLAVARPVDGGYLSVRLKPTTPVFDAIRDVYTRMARIEADVERAGGSRDDAMDASTTALVTAINDLGFPGYDAFMHRALAAEVAARRDALLGDRARDHTAASGTAQRHADVMVPLGTRLDAQLTAVERYAALNRQLEEQSVALVDIAEEGKVLALNAVLASRRLGHDGGPLVAVAEALQQTFPKVSDRARTVVSRIDQARFGLQHVGFAVALAVLQSEMVSSFRDELRTGRHAAPDATASTADDLGLLAGCLHADVTGMFERIDEVHAHLAETTQSADALERDLVELAAIERNGRVEAARTSGSSSFSSLLDDVRERLDRALAQTRQIGAIAHQLDRGHSDGERRRLLAELDAVAAAVQPVA